MDQKEKYPLEYVYPPQPFTVRGLSTSIDAHATCKKIIYCVSNIVVVRSTEDLTKCSVFDLHKFETTAVRISPNGNLCASADVRGNVFIWEINSKDHPVNKTFENVLGGAIKDIAWTGDGQRIVFAGEGKTYYAKAILLDTGSSLGDISGLSKPLFCCDMRQQRPFRLAVGGEEFLVGFYEGPPFKFKRSSKQHNNYVMCLRYNKNGDFFVTGSSDRKLFLYQGLDCNELKELKGASNHERTVTGISWFDDSTFVTSSNDCTIKLWNINDEDNLMKTLKVAEKPQEIEDMQVAVAEVEGDVYAFSLSGSLNQWKNAKSAQEGSLPTNRFHGHQNLVGAIIYDAKYNLTISGDNNGKIVIWTESREAILPEGQGHQKMIVGLALNSDSTKLYSIGGEELKRVDIVARKFEHTTECKGQLLAVVGAATDPDSCFVLFENNLIQKFTDMKLSKEYKLAYETSTFGISHDDKFFFVGDKEGGVHQMEVETGTEVHKFTLYATRVTAVTVAKDHKLLLAGDTTGKIKLWNYEDKKELTGDRWVHHTTIISSLSFSASYKSVISTGQDNKFTIYDVATQAKVGEKLNAHKRGILTAVVTPSGQIVTSGGDNAVKVWQPSDPLV